MLSVVWGIFISFYVSFQFLASQTMQFPSFVQITSDLVDIGFKGRLTLQLHSTQPVKIYKGMKIGQVMFWRVFGDVNLYDGKYQSSLEPRESEVWRDFK